MSLLLDDLAHRLVDQGVGTIGVDIFTSSSAAMPTGVGPYITLIETGGTTPTRVQNSVGPNTQRPSVQVITRAQKTGTMEAYPVAREKARLAYQALDGIFNTFINGRFYQHVVAVQEPTDMGYDPTGLRAMVSFNLNVEHQSDVVPPASGIDGGAPDSVYTNSGLDGGGV